MVRSADLVAVGRHLKAQAQPFGGALAHEHALEEDFEVIHHGADRLVQLDFQGDDLFGGVDFQLGRQGGVVYLVVLVEGFPDLIADAVAAHVGLVGQDQGRRHGVYGRAAALVVLADGRDDDGDVLRRRAPMAEELEGHEGSRVGVVDAVDAVAQVVHVAGDAGQLDGVLVVAELFQDFAGCDGDLGGVAARMLRVAQDAEHFVALFEVDVQFFGVHYVFIGEFFHSRAVQGRPWLRLCGAPSLILSLYLQALNGV